ncbi:MAG: hypothetical protein ACREV9_06845 [Burkholderiales bacterium]
MPLLNGETRKKLVGWIESKQAQPHARGYQGEVFLYRENGERYIVKAASGRGIARALRARMLENEFAAYQKLEDFAASPRCYGFLDGKYLVLEYIEGISVRRGEINDPVRFFEELFAAIVELHRRGIAHADLKRKDNLLVVEGNRPCVLDFGTAIIRKDSFAPLNRLLFKFACQTDLNAWIKLKYRKRMAEISPDDRLHYHRTFVESALREGKRFYKWIKRKLL